MHRRGWRLPDWSPADPVREPLTVLCGEPSPRSYPNRRTSPLGRIAEFGLRFIAKNVWSRHMPSIDELCSKVSATAMFAHLEEFAKRVKLSGTPEELESFHYLQGQLDEIGFSTALIQHDAYISLPGKARLEAGPERPACITHSFSRPTGPE